MPSANEFLEDEPTFILLVNGMPDSGKSDLAMTFPSCYVITFDPTGFNILRNKTERSRALAKNLVHIEPTKEGWDNSKLFSRPTRNPDPNDRSSIMACLSHAATLAKTGAVKTIVLDGFNYLVSAWWGLVCEDTKNFSPNTGALDRFSAYRDIKLKLNDFMWANLLPLAIRNGLNLVVTCHIKRESPEAIEGVDAKGNKTGAGKVARDSDLTTLIEGTFRNEIDGKFGAVIWLEHQRVRVKVKTGNTEKVEKRIKYFAHCQLSEGLGTVIYAKNKYGLPAKIDITGKSFYEILMEAQK